MWCVSRETSNSLDALGRDSRDAPPKFTLPGLTGSGPLPRLPTPGEEEPSLGPRLLKASRPSARISAIRSKALRGGLWQPIPNVMYNPSAPLPISRRAARTHGGRGFPAKRPASAARAMLRPFALAPVSFHSETGDCTLPGSNVEKRQRRPDRHIVPQSLAPTAAAELAPRAPTASARQGHRLHDRCRCLAMFGMRAARARFLGFCTDTDAMFHVKRLSSNGRFT